MAGAGEAEGLEVGGEVGLPVAAAELDDADGLAGSAGCGGELVGLGDLGRGVAGGRCIVRLNFADAEVRLGLGAVIEAEYSLARSR